MTDHPNRRLSDNDILAGFIERLPKWWGAVSLIFVGISSYAITSYKWSQTIKTTEADHSEIQSLKVDVAQIAVKIDQIDDIKEEIHDMRDLQRRILRKMERDPGMCFSDEDFTQRIVDGVKAVIDAKKRR